MTTGIKKKVSFSPNQPCQHRLSQATSQHKLTLKAKHYENEQSEMANGASAAFA